MSVRRLAEEQPGTFAFTSENQAIAEREIAKYPEGRQHSAVIALLWQAQLQHGGWLPEPAIRLVAEILEMPYIRALEVATFYTMFNLEPVGTTAHIQVCGTTPCMLRGAEELKAICRNRIHAQPQHLSEDGAFSWQEVECAGACVNAPMVQIDSDTFEDLTPETFNLLLDDLAAGRPVKPGPQVDRQFSAPEGGATTLTSSAAELHSREHASDHSSARSLSDSGPKEPSPIGDFDVKPAGSAEPYALSEPRGGTPDDLQRISGVGPKIEKQLHDLGIYHFDQIAEWREENIAWMNDKLRFKGRIQRENWIEQAGKLSADNEEEG